MKYISLTGKHGIGKFTIVDNEDFDVLNKYNWHVAIRHSQYYVARSEYVPKTRRSRCILMHREVTRFPEKMQVDHRNCNGLDNRKENLRICTNQQNNMNKVSYRNSSSKYKGVYKDNERGGWAAQITIDGKKKFIGRYKIEEDAAVAYDRFAIKLFGEFAKLNQAHVL